MKYSALDSKDEQRSTIGFGSDLFGAPTVKKVVIGCWQRAKYIATIPSWASDFMPMSVVSCNEESEIGGTIGLYVGATLLTVAETIVFFIEKRTRKLFIKPSEI
ncbi:unnamed protein product [Toxocara canis]|uniref:FMRFamide receptor n=1 Tax=Toxocara canis TaxID=6265 RepID=A0A183TY62_TOXCA|nr:unnamed protein product [Toxocara canis]